MSSRTHLITLLTTLAITPPISLAGDLNPPGGPVAPSMRTLDEVEARTIVNDTNTPGDATATYVISQPGSYYLTGDVNGVFGMHGIRIDARGVTLDLNGFAVVLNQINLRGAPPTVNGINATPIPLLDGAIVIRTHQLTKQYGDFKAADEISVAVKRGEVFGLLGPNGAGQRSRCR